MWEKSHNWCISKGDKGESQQRRTSLARWATPLRPQILWPVMGAWTSSAGRDQKGFEHDLHTPGTKHTVGAFKISNQDVSTFSATQAQVVSNYSHE